MKNLIQNPARFISTSLFLAVTLLANNVRAAINYWDPVGTWPAIPPAYTGDLSGTWESSLWSTAGTGTASPGAWAEGAAVCFAVGTGLGTPDFTMTMNNNHTVAGVFIGPLTPNSCHVTITGPGIMTLPSNTLQGFDLITSTDGATAYATVNTTIAGSGAVLVAEGDGQLFLHGTNTWTGGTLLGYSAASFHGIVNFNNIGSFGTGSITISNTSTGIGALVVEGSSALTITNAVKMAASSGARLNIVGNTAGLTFSGPWTLSSTANIASGGGSTKVVVISGVMSGSGGLNIIVVSGNGILQLTGANTFSGKTTIGGGTLKVASLNKVSGGSANSNLGHPTTTANGTIAIGSGSTAGTLYYTGAGETTDRVINLAGTTGGANIRNEGTGALVFSSACTATGAGAKTLTLNGGNTAGGSIGKIVDNSAANPTSLTKSGSTTWTITGASTYSGATTISAGTLKLGVANALPSGTGKGDVTVTSTLDLGGFSSGAGPLNGAGTVDNSAGTGTYTLTIGANGNSGSFSGVIQNTSGTVALTKSGAGTQTLSGANAYAGNTIVSAGTLQLGAADTLPAASSVVVNNGATLDMQNLNNTVAAIGGSGTVGNLNGILTANGSAATVNTNNFNGYSCLAGPLIGFGTLVKDGTHAMGVRANLPLNFAGTLTFNAGTLSVGAAPDRLSTSTALTVPGGALFQLDANNQTVSSLNGSGSVNLGGGVLTIAQYGSDSFGGVIQNSELPGSSTALGYGLRGYYYDNIDLTNLKAVRDDAMVNFTDLAVTNNITGLPDAGIDKNCVSARWLGKVLTTTAGTYTFTTTCDDGRRLWVNGQLVIDGWVSGSSTKSGTIDLAGNTQYDIVLEWFNGTGGSKAQLLWTPPGDLGTNVIPAEHLFLPGPGRLVLSGGGTQQLTAAGTYSGGTTVTGGTLDATVGGALGSGNVTVADGASLQLESNAGIGSGADVVVGAFAAGVNLNYSGTDNIRALSLDGGSTYEPVGNYGASAANPTGVFSGSGLLHVTAGPSANVLTTSASPAVYGTTVTLTSTITPSGATGTVTFYDGANWLGTATLVSGVATLSVNNLQVGFSHSLTAVYGGDATHAPSTSNIATVDTTVATLTPSVVVSNKVYDATTAASISFASTNFTGMRAGDENFVHLDTATATAAFVDKNVGTGKTVNLSGLALAGSLSGNYVLSSSTATTTADITPKTLTAPGLTGVNKVYDGTTTAPTPTGTAALQADEAPGTGTSTDGKPYTGDTVTLGGSAVSATFATKDVGTGKTVTVTGYSLSGGDAGNYQLSVTTTAAITQDSTTCAIVSSVNPSVNGQSITFTATVTGVVSAADSPTGTMTFFVDNTSVATPTVSAAGANTATATYTTSALTPGDHAVKAQYMGDTNFSGSTSSDLTQTVSVGSAPATITAITPGAGVFTITYANGQGAQFVLLRGTNAAQPLPTWSRVDTNSTGSGSFNAAAPSEPLFWRILSE